MLCPYGVKTRMKSTFFILIFKKCESIECENTHEIYIFCFHIYKVQKHSYKAIPKFKLVLYNHQKCPRLTPMRIIYEYQKNIAFREIFNDYCDSCINSLFKPLR